MKKIFVTLAAALVAFAASAILDSAASAQDFSSRWEIIYKSAEKQLWTSQGEIASARGAEATLSVKGSGLSFDFADKKHYFEVAGMKPGDSIELSAPLSAPLPKGSLVDVAIYLGITKKGGPANWAFEWFDGKKWREVEKGPAFRTTREKGWNETSFIKSFRTGKELKDALKVRFRVIDGCTDPEAEVYLINRPRVGAYLAASTVPAKDSKRILFIGNSFTFYGATDVAFIEICRSQGHTVDARMNVKGGQNFGQHLGLVLSREAIAEGGYDVALLQNQSQSGSFYATDPKAYAYLRDDAIAMAAEVREYSPSCRLILERTWASPKEDWRGFGSAEAFDEALQKGSEQIGKAMDAELSPIGNAFILGRAAGLDLYWTDNFHQNFTGAYLKACVNYLMVYGEPFGEGVSDYCLDPEVAAKCREIAAKVVFK